MPPRLLTAQMIARSRTLAEPRWSPSGRSLGWIDGFDGRYDLVVAPSDGTSPPSVVTADVALTPVGGYGGGAWTWAGDDEMVVAAADGRLLRLRADGGGVVATLSRDGTALGPAVSPDGTRVAFIVERSDSCDVAVVPLDGSAWPRRVSRADFAWDPAWSADSRHLAWHEWDLPAMPWEASRIAFAEVADDGRATAPRVIAGGARARVGVGQPRWSPDGRRLAYVTDADGPTQIVVAGAAGSRPTVLRAEPYDHAPASWSPGLRTFAWSPDGNAIAYVRNERGFGRLVRAAPRASGGGQSPSGASRGRAGVDLAPRGASRGRAGVESATAELGKAFFGGLDWSSRSCRDPFGCAHRAAGGGGRRAVRRAAFARARPRCRLRGVRARGADSGALAFRRRDRARPAVPTGARTSRGRPAECAADARPHPRRADRPGPSRLEPAGRVLGVARLGGAATELPGFDRLRAGVPGGARRQVGRPRRPGRRFGDPPCGPRGMVRPGSASR